MRRGNDDWLTLVRWVLFALVAAEENGITEKSADGPGAGPALRRDSEVAKELAAAVKGITKIEK